MLKYALLVVLLFASIAAAVEQDPVGLSDFPVPAWPQDGKIPPELKEKYVFVDLPKNEYVVAYPENLGTDTFAQNPGALRINRYELLRDVAPAVSVEITAAKPGVFKYAYTVANGGRVKQSIDQWILVLPEQSVKDAIRQPDGWFAIIQKGRTFKLKNPEWIRSGSAAIWSFHKLEKVVQPGTSLKGFELESELRPGFNVAYFRRSESIDVKVATHGNVPKVVKDQIDQVLAIEYNSRTALVMAPKFDKSADDHVIAGDFIQGILTLSRAGALDLTSEFTRSVLNELTAIKPGTKGTPVRLTVPAKTAVETEILNALKACLNVS
ncbi:MAG: hypothetical protein HY646_04330 [Acidobacteria bacterium]|nr:hypothetical protein [Acidobacteriota bacterium]